MEQKLKKDPKIFDKKYDYGRNTNILHFIAKYGNIDMLKYVIEQKRALNEEGKVDVDVTDVYETTPTFLAICNGNNEIAKYLIEECNANVNVRDCWSTPMLYCAIKSENLELVKYLIEHGADINLHGSDDNSMVHRAAFYGADNISKYIIEQQNDPKQFYDKDGVPMVINAVKYERLDILQHLMKKPFININEVDKDNKTALYYAFYRDNPKILDYLLKNGADINTEGVTGQKILTEAIKQNNLDFVKYLTETKHVDINNVNEHNHTPIYTAVRKNNIEIVKYLATKGVDVNKQYKNGNTLTHKAIEQNNFEMVKCLADNGAKLNIPNNDGITPLQQMFITDKKDMINYLLNNHNEEVELVFKLRQAIENEDLNTVKYLVEEKGVDVNTAFYDKVTPVHKAVELGNMEIAKYLIEQGADINAKDKDNRGLDHYVAIGGNLELLKYLIEEKQFYTKIKKVVL